MTMNRLPMMALSESTVDILSYMFTIMHNIYLYHGLAKYSLPVRCAIKKTIQNHSKIEHTLFHVVS